MTEVSFQSRRMAAVRRRTRPESTPLYDRREASAEIEVDVGAGVRSQTVGTEGFQAKDRLPQRASHRT